MIDPSDIVLSNFLNTWHGPPDKTATPIPPSSDWLPAPLKVWHNLASERSTRLTYNTSMILPHRIQPDGEGKAIFMVDATADWRWCFAVEDPETVFDAERHTPWERNPERLSQLLVHNAVKEAVYGAPARIRAPIASNHALAEILSPLEEVAFGKWSWPAPGYRLFMGNEILAEIIESEDSTGWHVEMAALRPEALSCFAKIPGTTWRKPKE